MGGTAPQQIRCSNCRSTNVRKAWAPTAMLTLGILCLAGGVVSGGLILRTGNAPALILPLLLLCAAVLDLVRWNSFRGRTYYECRLCGRRWARVREA